MGDTRGGDQSGALQGQIVEERFGYYRRCQRFRKNGQQCKTPAMKDSDRCYKHQEQADVERRRRAQFTLPPLVDLKTVQRAIGDVAQALIQDRIDETTRASCCKSWSVRRWGCGQSSTGDGRWLLVERKT
ncbi:MAG: hypothetical protein JWN42_2724 [Candidatus Angelobacter sp.]|nr:hypothetical protein [Candidatus Angelobacter sp.]